MDKMFNVKIDREACLVIGRLRVNNKGCFMVESLHRGEVENFINMEVTRAQAMAVCAIARSNGLTPRVVKPHPKRFAYKYHDNGELFARAALILNK